MEGQHIAQGTNGRNRAAPVAANVLADNRRDVTDEVAPAALWCELWLSGCHARPCLERQEAACNAADCGTEPAIAKAFADQAANGAAKHAAKDALWRKTRLLSVGLLRIAISCWTSLEGQHIAQRANCRNRTAPVAANVLADNRRDVADEVAPAALWCELWLSGCHARPCLERQEAACKSTKCFAKAALPVMAANGAAKSAAKPATDCALGGECGICGDGLWRCIGWLRRVGLGICAIGKPFAEFAGGNIGKAASKAADDWVFGQNSCSAANKAANDWCGACDLVAPVALGGKLSCLWIIILHGVISLKMGLFLKIVCAVLPSSAVKILRL